MAKELVIARQLYAQAYEPTRAAPTLEALEGSIACSGPPTRSRNGHMRFATGR